ncbi:hypothetical protein GOP47_0017008 [Adiantum capillus-veneris]|uniref:Uncharacterized protein n=1 Tax=Adiantum capillus-veneris TaxID=13818 RepID=A0A9D4ZAV1_ADICA|nr:hypothetical protein GOP47_0017008 [Adiantum capillus-veneris]
MLGENTYNTCLANVPAFLSFHNSNCDLICEGAWHQHISNYRKLDEVIVEVLSLLYKSLQCIAKVRFSRLVYASVQVYVVDRAPQHCHRLFLRAYVCMHGCKCVGHFGRG